MFDRGLINDRAPLIPRIICMDASPWKIIAEIFAARFDLTLRYRCHDLFAKDASPPGFFQVKFEKQSEQIRI